MGKNKAEKVVDLKTQKITDEQLGEVQKIVTAMNRGQMELGMLETRKHNMLHDVAVIQDKLAKMQGEFEKQYGTYDINIENGTINYSENGEVNKKD